ALSQMSTSPPIPASCPHCGGDMAEGSELCSQCEGQLRNTAPPATTNWRERAAAVASYLTPIPAILLLLVKPYSHSSFVRFHAFQSIIIGIVVLALLIIGILL